MATSTSSKATAAVIRPINTHQTEVVLTIDGQAEFAFRYFSDELSFTEQEFVGLTLDEARALHGRKDREYLRGW